MTESNLSLAVQKHRELILDAEKWLWRHPETGYREWSTSAYMESGFERLGYALRRAGNIPGFTTVIDTGRPGPRVLVLGELDSLICADHPDADPATGAVHACGHHAQCAALLGIAAALKEDGALNGLCGSICLCAVPAEELIEIEYRNALRKAGTIRYFGGKVEFMYRGLFDEVDMAIMVHTTSGDAQYRINRGGNGCVVKHIEYLGKASHAGEAPQHGINALYAANLGMQAVNALRETFQDNDHIRFHPIMTSGGTVVNAIPSRATMESYVRGASIDAIVSANRRINRALAASAAAMGAGIHLIDRPGYAPLINDLNLRRIAAEAAGQIAAAENISVSDEWNYGCTDMGDLSSVMPALHPYAGGADGVAHGNSYRIVDPEIACIGSARFQLSMLELLLQNGAAEAKRVLAEKSPRYPSFKDYFIHMDRIELDAQPVHYGEDGTVTLSV